MRFSTSFFSVVLAAAHFDTAVGTTPKLDVDGSQVVELSDRRYLRDTSQFERMLMGGVPTCGDQSNCISVSSESIATPLGAMTDCATGTSYYKICMILDTNLSGCAKNGDTVSHICYKSNVGSAATSYPNPGYCETGDGNIETKPPNSASSGTWCQIVACGDAAEFVVKDANAEDGCGVLSKVALPASTNGGTPVFADASCTTYGKSNIDGGCSGGGNVGKECIWSFPAPECLATTTTDAATTTTEAATTTTAAATTTKAEETTTTAAATTTTAADTTTTAAATTTKAEETTTTAAATTTTAADTTTTTPGSGGDPHFQTFGNTFFDFHGGCDLVLGSMPSFAKGLGLLVQLRTTTRYDYSFIESVAIKIGEDILEISSFGQYMLNGISNAVTPFMMSGHSVVYTEPRDNQHRFTIELGDNMNINVKVFKDLVYVSMDVAQGSDADFSDTVGLMGSWKTGARVARDGVTVLEDPIEFGQEWQVQSEANLFMTARAPQYPVKCEMPDPVERSSRRRLGESITAEAAGIACAHVKGDHAHDMCIFDVIATNDLTVGQGGAY